MITLITLAAPALAGGISINATATCPGPTAITVTGATPGGMVAIVSGDAPGSTIIPSGGCAGGDIGLAGNVKVRRMVAADGSGAVSVNPDLPGAVCGSWVAALDLSSCNVARPDELAGPPSLVGAFNVHDGESWGYNPPTYTCQEACSLIFGGAAGDYSCSTNSATVTNTAYASTWGYSDTCYDPGIAEDYKLNTYYDCGYPGCSVSAYVQDNCLGAADTYCFN